MSEKPTSDVSEIKEVILAAAQLTNATYLAIQDHKFTIADLAYFIPALLTLPPAFENIGEIVDQFENLDEDGKLELQEYVKQELNIPNERAAEYIRESFNFASSLFLLINNFAKFLRDSKALSFKK